MVHLSQLLCNQFYFNSVTCVNFLSLFCTILLDTLLFDCILSQVSDCVVVKTYSSPKIGFVVLRSWGSFYFYSAYWTTIQMELVYFFFKNVKGLNCRFFKNIYRTWHRFLNRHFLFLFSHSRCMKNAKQQISICNF